MTGGTRIGVLGVVMLVLLRMCIGLHFFSEGMSKLEPGFSSAGFLQNATGPLGPYFRSFAPTFHDWDQLLAHPRQAPDYVSRSDADPAPPVATVKPQRESVQLAADHPASAWGNRVLHDWEETLEEFVKTPRLSEEQQKQAEAVFDARATQLIDYLNQEAAEIADYRHELWRLANWQAKETTGQLPYHDRRIAAKRAETNSVPRRWVRDVEQMEIHYAEDLRRILSDAQFTSALAMRHVDQALEPPSRLQAVDRGVTVLTIAAGICLLVGFGTRIAAIAAALFLLSVMATQPPWVPSAVTTYFWYQLVEFTALLALAAIGAGRWAGLDALVYRLWSGCCRTTKEAPPK